MIDFFLADLLGLKGAKLTGLCAYTQRYPAFTRKYEQCDSNFFQKMTICCSLKKYGNGSKGEKFVITNFSPNLPISYRLKLI